MDKVAFGMESEYHLRLPDGLDLDPGQVSAAVLAIIKRDELAGETVEWNPAGGRTYVDPPNVEDVTSDMFNGGLVALYGAAGDARVRLAVSELERDLQRLDPERWPEAPRIEVIRTGIDEEGEFRNSHETFGIPAELVDDLQPALDFLFVSRHVITADGAVVREPDGDPTWVRLSRAGVGKLDGPDMFRRDFQHSSEGIALVEHRAAAPNQREDITAQRFNIPGWAIPLMVDDFRRAEVGLPRSGISDLRLLGSYDDALHALHGSDLEGTFPVYANGVYGTMTAAEMHHQLGQLAVRHLAITGLQLSPELQDSLNHVTRVTPLLVAGRYDELAELSELEWIGNRNRALADIAAPGSTYESVKPRSTDLTLA